MHFVDANFHRHDMVLATISMDGLRHTGENIAEKTRKCLIENDFSIDKVACCFRDDARNKQCATQELGIARH